MFRLIPFLLLLVALIPDQGKAQSITVRGKVYHAQDPLFNLLIVNKRTSQGTFGDANGNFEVRLDKKDTLLVGAIGYETQQITMADSALKEEYVIDLYLSRLAVNLRQVRVFAPRELDSIQSDIRKLGYDERDFMLSGIDAVQSPITFLYQQFSKKERLRRRAYEIINEDNKRNLLKELFAYYVDYDIIDLDESEFDDFVDFMNVPDGTLRALSQYDFIMYTKAKFEEFRNAPPRLRQELNTHD